MIDFVVETVEQNGFFHIFIVMNFNVVEQFKTLVCFHVTAGVLLPLLKLISQFEGG